MLGLQTKRDINPARRDTKQIHKVIIHKDNNGKKQGAVSEKNRPRSKVYT